MSLIYKIYMEVYAVKKDKPTHLHSEKQLFHERKEKMEKLNVNLTQAANYLIQLFYKTGQRYTCTRTKIGKLLSILAFEYARSNKLIFNESICKYGDCGTAIDELKAEVDRDVYLQCNYNDDGKFVNIPFDNSVEIPEKHSAIDKISDNIKTDIENIFRTFGSYSASELGKFICPIVNKVILLDENDNIILSSMSSLTLENFDNDIECNTLLNYLFKQD